MSTATLAQPLLPAVGSFTGGTEGAATNLIYAGDGQPLGVFSRRNHANPQYQANLSEAMRLFDRVIAGDRRAAVTFQEALSRSDFNFLFADIIDRQMLAAYQTRPVQWSSWAKRGRVRDFRTVKRFTLDGGAAVLSPVEELAPYPVREVADGGYEYRVGKFGDRIGISWETIVNDDLDALTDLPQRLGLGGRRTEERFATALFASSTGPNSVFFSTANRNVINPTVLPSTALTNPPLSISALQLAMTVMGNQVDPDGGPIFTESYVLVVPPALEVVANNIINSTQIMAASGGGDGTGNDQLLVNNWMRNRVQVAVDPWLPIIDTTTGHTAWYLFANPNVGRPAMEVGFLIGHETPELWVKAPNAMRVGGGMVDPLEGDFDHDAIHWRVRHVIGGVLQDPKSALASDGSGS